MTIPDKFEGQIRVSASRIKSLSKCSFKFYLNEIEKLPEKTHPKTIVGSICHSVFECLKRPRHRKYYDQIVKTGTLNGTPFQRLVKMWQQKHNIDQSLINDIDGMIMVALKYTDFYHKNATRIFDPEHEFKMELKTGIVKGFIDDMAFFENKGKIRDYKSQKEKFTKKELESEMQATIYQLYVWKKFDILAEVEFVMLRHSPTPKHPTLHLQVVPPKSPAQLKGFEIYLEHMGTVFKNFGLNDAYADFAADDPKRKNFCEYVCQFKNPFEYQCVTKNGILVKNYFLTENITLKEGEKIEIRKHNGCPKFNPIS